MKTLNSLVEIDHKLPSLERVQVNIIFALSKSPSLTNVTNMKVVHRSIIIYYLLSRKVYLNTQLWHVARRSIHGLFTTNAIIFRLSKIMVKHSSKSLFIILNWRCSGVRVNYPLYDIDDIVEFLNQSDPSVLTRYTYQQFLHLEMGRQDIGMIWAPLVERE